MGLGKTYSTKYLLDSNNSSGVAGQVLSTTATGIDWVNANTVPGAGLWIESGNNIYNSNSDNVGIGVTSPGAKLDVVGPSNGSSILKLQRNGVGNGYAFGISDIGTGSLQLFTTALGDDSGFVWRTRQSGGSVVEALFIAPDGKVGIGTTSPSQKLEVNGAVLAGDYRGSAQIYLTSPDAWIFRSTGGSERMRVNSNGNVGINDTSPDFKLDVGGTLGVSDLPGNGSSTSVLVQNQTTTSLAVDNGDFATDIDWSKGTGWTISGGKANVDGTQSATTYLSQSGILPNPSENIEYIINYTISNYSAGTFVINVGGYAVSSPGQIANGTYEVKVIPVNALSNTLVYIQATADAVGSIDNISVKQVTAGSDQIQVRELGTGAFGPTPVGAFLPLTAGSTKPLSGDLYVNSGKSLYLSGTSGLRLLNDGANGIIINNTGDLKIQNAASDKDIIFRVLDGVSNNEVMRIDGSTSNVGIGTTSPDYKLDVEGDISLVLEGENYAILSPVSQGMNISVGDPADKASPLMNLGGGGTQNVGIGTTSPAKKLHVKESTTDTYAAYIENSIAGGDYLAMIGDAGDPVFEFDSGGTGGEAQMKMYSDNVLKNLLDANGSSYFSNSIGIGTTSPQAKLEIGSTSGAASGQYNSPSALLIGTSGGSGGAGGTLLFGADGSSASDIQWSISNANTDSNATGSVGNLNFNTKQTKAGTVLSPAMTILNNGLVGIGTANPSYKLEVNGGDAKIVNGSTGTLYMQNNANYLYGDTNGVGIVAAGNNFRIKTNNVERLRILQNGNVGIGTTFPGSKLEVSTTNQSFSTAIGNAVNIAFPGGSEPGNVGGGLVFSQYYFSGATTVIRTGGIYGIKTGPGGSFGGGLAFYTQPESAADMVQRMVINDLGNVGIGSDDADSKLDIVGSTIAGTSSLLRVRTTNNPNNPHKVVGFYVNTNTERGFIAVNQFATSYSTSSDYRLKENIVPIPNSIERLKQLKPCRFNFIQGDPNYVVDGFIAHEAAEVIPEAVTGEKDAVDENNNPSYQGIDQSKVVPLLTAALQQAIDKIEQLETRIQTIENN